MNRSKVITLVVLCITVGINVAQAQEFPVTSYESIDARFIPDEAAMEGVAEIQLNPDYPFEETIKFYLHGELRVSEIIQNGKKVEYARDLERFDYTASMIALVVGVKKEYLDLNQPVTIKWYGPIHQSNVRAQSNFMRIDSTGVYLRGYYYSFWYPMVPIDSRSPYPVDFKKVVLRTPEKFLAVFTGEKVSDAVENGESVSIWKSMNTSLSETQAIAREYEITCGGGITVYHLRNEQSKAAAIQAIEKGQRAVELMKQWYKPDAHLVESILMEMPEYGDIGSGNIVGVAGDFWQGKSDGARFFNTYAHELVHEFVQKQLDRDNPMYAFCLEAVPSYYHWPVMEELLGQDYYDRNFMNLEKAYFYHREHGKTRRGATLSPEKPITEIKHDEIGRYKDYFVLGDRAKLFLNYLRVKMGKENFLKFTREFVLSDSINLETYIALVEKYLPGSGDDVKIWLTTTDYPEKFSIASLN